MTLRIRNATLEDCLRCEELSKTPELEDTQGNTPKKEYLQNFVDDDELFLVAEQDNVVIGFLLGEPMKGGVVYSGLGAIDPQYRSQGVGEQLFQAWFDRCREKGYLHIFGITSVDNPRTLRFHEKVGFRLGKLNTQIEYTL